MFFAGRATRIARVKNSELKFTKKIIFPGRFPLAAATENNVTSTQIRMHVAAQNRRRSDVLLVLIIIAIIKFQGRPSHACITSSQKQLITGLRLVATSETAAGAPSASRPARSRPARGQFLARSRPSASGNSRKLPPESPPRRAPVSASDSARRYNFFPAFSLHLCCGRVRTRASGGWCTVHVSLGIIDGESASAA